MHATHENRPLCAIRGFAALWVVLYHLTGFAPAVLLPGLVADGWAGVDIFFVLSGFILTAVYGAAVRDDLGGFYLKRLCRIYPLHLAIMSGLALMVLAGPHLGLPLGDPRFHQWSNFPVVALLLQNFLPEFGQWWNAPSWSAGVELACYAMFPLCVPTLCGLGRVARLGLMAGLASLQIWLQFGAVEGVYVGLAGLGRGASGFFIGVALHGLVRDWRPSAAQASLAEAVALGGIAASCAGAVPCLVQGFGAVLVAALSRDIGVMARLLRAAPLVWLGRVSFSIYLLHDPMMALLLKLLPVGGAIETTLTPVLHRLLIVALVVGAAGVTYRMIEVPGRWLARTGTVRALSRTAPRAEAR